MYKQGQAEHEEKEPITTTKPNQPRREEETFKKRNAYMIYMTAKVYLDLLRQGYAIKTRKSLLRREEE